MEGPFDKYTFRCSSLGKIVGKHKDSVTDIQLAKIAEFDEKRRFKALTDKQEEEYQKLIKKRDAPPELPDTCTAYLKQVYNQVQRGFTKEITSKYLEKGLSCEGAGITMLQNTIFHKLRVPLMKNQQRFYNEFIEGEPDIIYAPVVPDIKNAYDWETFDNAKLTNEYEVQLRGYMALTKCTEAILFYCLLNMPEHMLYAEFNKHFYSGPKYLGREDPEYLKACDVIAENYNFEKFPMEDRFRFFQVKHDQAIIDSIYERIKECRVWLNKYHSEKLEFARQNRILMGTETEITA